MRRLRGIFAAAGVGAFLLSGALAAETRVYVRVAPPPLIVETRPVAPGPHHVWVEGYHRWDGHAYLWVPGRWAIPPHHRSAWVPGHWKHVHSGWYWVPGHWR